MTWDERNGFTAGSEPAEGWRVELPSGDVFPVAVEVKQNFFTVDAAGGPVEPSAMGRALDTVRATVVIPDTLSATQHPTGEFTIEGRDSCVRWALSSLVRRFGESGWRVWLLAPGEPSRAEALQRARELLAVSERFREAWMQWKHEVLNDPALDPSDPATREAYHRIVGKIPCGHGALERAARAELGPLWPGWQDRAEFAYAALTRVAAAAGVAAATFIDPEALAKGVEELRRDRDWNLRRAEGAESRENLLQKQVESLVDAALTDREAEPAARLRAALVHALGYCYAPADQTVMCPECDAAWWRVSEDIHENWHAPGCKLFAARVLAGEAVDVTRPRDPGDGDFARPGPRPDPRTPAEKLRDVVLEGWFSRVARLGYADAPKDVDPQVWMRAVHAVMDLLPRPATGPYGARSPNHGPDPTTEAPATSPDVIARDGDGRPVEHDGGAAPRR